MMELLSSLMGLRRTKRGVRPRRERWTKLIGLGFVALLALAACSSAADDRSPAGEGAANALPADFTITLYQGQGALGVEEEVRLSDLLSQDKPIVLNFWAGLCPPCRLEMPDLQAVHEAFEDRVLLFGLDVGPFTALGSNEDGKALIQALGVTYPAGTTPDASVVQAYQVTGMPSTYFIKPDGEVFRTWTGLLTEAKLTELVEELLAAAQDS